MTKEQKRTAKTEVLSMRMDPKTRFVIDMIAKVRGQSISTVVDRAIQEAADRLTIGNPDDDQGPTWRDYWHVIDGVRALKISRDQRLFPTFEEEYRLEFTKKHWQFFYTSSQFVVYREDLIEILWSRIDEFLEMWDKTKASDYFAAGKAMRKAISDAGVAPPDWPPKKIDRPETAELSSGGKPVPRREQRPNANDLDEEIPF
jgi:hypothetical protein